MKRPPAPVSFKSSRSAETNAVWEVTVAGELNEQAGELIDKLVQVPLGSRGLIYFDTGGGSAYAGLAMATIIRLRGLRAMGVVAGECSSAALLPFAACERRIVTRESSLFFHPMRWQSEEDVRLEEAVEWTRHFREMEQDLDELLARLFGLPRETIVQWSHPGRFVRGAELAAIGVAELVDLFSGDLKTQIRIAP